MNIELHALDQMDSVLWSDQGGAPQGFAYDSYGSSGPMATTPGYNGERLDPVGLTYHPGNGYRTYSPTLMRFTAPDSWSPFGAGGLNAYAYCEGDPINRSDPSGHLSGRAWAGIGLGILGLFLTVVSGGMAIAAEGSVAAAWAAASVTDIVVGATGAVADVTAIASGATSEVDPEASMVLGWISFGMGMVGMISGMSALGKSVDTEFKKKLGAVDLLDRDDSITMTLGGRPQNVKALSRRLYAFDDEYKGGRRLNVLGHGNKSAMYAGHVGFDEETLVDLLRAENIDCGNYDSIRLISCNTAGGGADSFAQKLANLTGLPVKAFKGSVGVRINITTAISNGIFRQTTSNVVKLLSHDGLTVTKFSENPTMARIQAYFGHRYRPVHLEPNMHF